MNSFHCVLFMVILFFAGPTLASDSNSVAATTLESGYFDITNLSNDWGYSIPYRTLDSTSGIYLFVESGWDGPCCVSPYYTSFSIGKYLNSKQNDNIWVLTDFSGIDSLNMELKKGNPLSLDKFTKLEFDSTHVQYLLHANNRAGDIKVKRDFLDTLKAYHPDSLEYLSEQEYMEYLASIDYINSLPEMYLLDYFLYQRENAVVALCGVAHSVCHYQIGCFYQDNGSFVFDSLPNPRKMARSIGCPNSAGSSVRPLVRNSKKKNDVYHLYKINGTPAFKGSSNIVIQNKQPKLHLKGK